MTPAPINLGELERLDLLERLTSYDYRSSYEGKDWERVTLEAADAIEALTARLRAAEGALRPFADHAFHYPTHNDGATIEGQAPGHMGRKSRLTVGHLRAAAKALPPPPDTTTSSGE